jgi:hypothetical protein
LRIDTSDRAVPAWTSWDAHRTKPS